MVDYFADSYALFAAIDNSKAYRPYFRDATLATTSLDLLEFAYGLHKRGRASKIDAVLPPFLDIVVEPRPQVAAEAAAFKHARISAGGKCSYVDAWGYATARSLDVPFLTGDEDFRGIPGVKFVKA